MVKSGPTKRKRNVQPTLANKLRKIPSAVAPPPDPASANGPKSIRTIISEDELETTICTLNLLSEHPNLIKSKGCKGLRAAVYEFRQACTTGVNTIADTNLTARITAALTDGKYTEARALLAEMRIRSEGPKLGALCRWVRDLDVVSGLSTRVNGTAYTSVERSAREKELLLVLDAILRVVGQIDLHSLNYLTSPNLIALQNTWNLRNSPEPSYRVSQNISEGGILKKWPSSIKEQFRVIEITAGPLRKPPNDYPAILYASRDDAISISPTPTATTKHKHPIVPNLSLIKNVLSVSECANIIAATENIGFTADAPVRSDGENASVLAHNFYWIADESFCNKLWGRVKPHVPEQVGGRKVRGLNRRFRIYRYIPGAEYRCHIDGAWPPSGIDPSDKYIYDSSPPSARQSSSFTFLIYLNDDFEAGETTFFLPSVREGLINAYPVKPIMGSVAMFPHGETQDALLHEGTGVTKGIKYIIRTDVVYDVDETA